MNEVTNSNLHNLQLRTSAVLSKPDADKVEQGGKSLPSVAVSEQSSEKVKVVSTKNSAESVAQKQKNIESAVAEMNEYIQSTQRDIEFYVDDALGKTIVSVLDRESQEVIRQIPDEKFLKMARLLKEDIAAGTDDPLHLISARA